MFIWQQLLLQLGLTVRVRARAKVRVIKVIRRYLLCGRPVLLAQLCKLAIGELCEAELVARVLRLQSMYSCMQVCICAWMHVCVARVLPRQQGPTGAVRGFGMWAVRGWVVRDVGGQGIGSEGFGVKRWW